MRPDDTVAYTLEASEMGVTVAAEAKGNLCEPESLHILKEA